jgi:hypothetical protein
MKGSGHGLNLDVSVPQLNVYKRYMSHELENDPHVILFTADI